jgi:hypothetical protein
VAGPYHEFKRVKRGKENVERFLREFEAAGGRVGKPD